MKLQNVSGSFTIPDNLSKVATQNGVFVEVDTRTSPAIIKLPPPSLYPKIIIVDFYGNASENTISIQAHTNGKIEGDETVIINSNFGAMTFLPTNDDLYTTDNVITTGSTRIYTKELVFGAAELHGLDGTEMIASVPSGQRVDLIEVDCNFYPQGSEISLVGGITITQSGDEIATIPESLINSSSSAGITLRNFTSPTSFEGHGIDLEMQNSVLDGEGNPALTGDHELHLSVKYRLVALPELSS